MEKFVLKTALEMLGASYLGSANHSAKMSASYRNGTLTYCIYLAPWQLASTKDRKINVCPNGEHCHKNCLNGSGREKIAEFTDGINNKVMNCRIKRTRFFYDDRETFMQLLIAELQKYQRKAQKLEMEFSVRLNGTSDLSPTLFKLDGKNILEMFPNIQFYDYSKRPNSINEMRKYANYDVTFSYDGYNWDNCEKCLENGGKVAVVFYGNKLPKKFCGWNVEDGNQSDVRYYNSPQSVIGLHYHTTANDYKVNEFGKREFVVPNTPFVVMPNDIRCEW